MWRMIFSILCLVLTLHVRAYFSLDSHKLPHFSGSFIKGAIPIWTHLASHISSHIRNGAWHRNAPSAWGFKLSCCTHHLQKVKGTQNLRLYGAMDESVQFGPLLLSFQKFRLLRGGWQCCSTLQVVVGCCLTPKGRPIGFPPSPSPCVSLPQEDHMKTMKEESSCAQGNKKCTYSHAL